jgi:hypothetical protein
MAWRSRWLVAAWLMVSACGTERVDSGVADGGGEPPKPSPDAGKPVAECPPANPFCKNQSDAGVRPPPVCANAPINLDSVGVNVMIGIDGSASMQPHWPRIKESVTRLRAAHPEAQFGVHVFWGLVSTWDQARQKANWCGGTEHKFLDVGPHTAEELTALMGETAPGPGFFGIWETSPVVDPLDYYISNATKLVDPARTNYLLLISDGNDNCFGSIYSNQQDKVLAYEKIAVELEKRNVRVIPIGFDAVSATSWNGSYFTTPPTTNLEVLGTLLEHGGSGLTEVPKVEDPNKFAEVLEQVGLRVRSCRFTIPQKTEAEDVNPFNLTFTINGTEIPRDRTNTNGWNFVRDDIHQVELYGDSCQAVRAGAQVNSAKTCADDTCGSAALEVETKPRSVLFLLDSSASRIECVNGTLDCIFTVGQPNRTELTYWETVQHAVGQSLVQPINDDIEFGLQFFPNKMQAAFSCTVDAEPELPPAVGAQIRIISNMLEKLPLGRSPVVSVLENVAANPGRLADPGVQGAVVMLTDGGDNCAGTDQADITARLGAAARSLLDRGVKTYVVRFGSPGAKNAELEAQLRAIVAHGGTATSDPADMTQTPYVDAKDSAALESALAALSDELATCEIDVGTLDDKTDKTKANLYLNGVVVPKQAHGKDDGWSWKDEAQTVMELHGPSCQEFKTGRKSSVIVEFGCTPVLVI